MTSWNQFAPDYDYPPFAGQPNRYLIASTPRSGSHFLAHLLFIGGDLGSPLEYLNPSHQPTWRRILGTATWAETLQAQFRRRTSPSGWFGLKSHWGHFHYAQQEPGMASLLRFEFTIRITRDDTIAQAISLVIAEQTRAWISHHDPQGDAVYNFAAIRSAHDRIVTENREWDTYLASVGIAPVHVTYEALVACPNDVVRSIRTHLGLGVTNIPLYRPGPRPQATERNEAWYVRFLADLELIGGCRISNGRQG